MAIVVSSSSAPAAIAAIWDQIQVSESYLVSGMCDEAASVSSSVLKNLCCKRQIEETEQINDMLESAGMVLVQALKELGRTENILKELSQLFGSITAIPIQVFLAGVSFQLSEGTCQDTRVQVEEYLSNWKFVDDQYYYIPAAEFNEPANERGCVVGVEEYLEVVEIYIATLVGSVAKEKDIDTAVSWVEKAASLPEDKRQDLLRRLQSLSSHNACGSSQGSVNLSIDESPESRSKSLNEQQEAPDGFEETLIAPYAPNRENNAKQSILKLNQQRVGQCIWWFRSITFKLGNRQVAISNGKVVLGFLIVLVYYIMQRKQASFKKHLKRRVMSVRKGLVDLWELAFSYQVNPLAAVQPIPTVPRGSR